MTRSAANVTPLRPEAEAPKPLSRKATKASSLGPPPDWLSNPAKAAWRRLIPRLEVDAGGALSPLDVPALGLMLEHLAIAQAAARSMRGTGNNPVTTTVEDLHHGGSKKAPASQVMRDHAKAFIELAREYGMTLKSRSVLDLSGLLDPGEDGDDDDLFED